MRKIFFLLIILFLLESCGTPEQGAVRVKSDESSVIIHSDRNFLTIQVLVENNSSKNSPPFEIHVHLNEKIQNAIRVNTQDLVIGGSDTTSNGIIVKKNKEYFVAESFEYTGDLSNQDFKGMNVTLIHNDEIVDFAESIQVREE